MIHPFRTLLTVLFFSLLCQNLSAQYGDQFENRGFEQWTDRVSEPSHWHSGGTAEGTFAGFLSSQIESSDQVRPNATGSKSVRVFPTSIFGITANGALTNGRMYAGSISATDAGNYTFTQRANEAFNTPVSALPDSITLWVCFRSESATERALLRATVHGDADFRMCADGTENPTDMRVASAMFSFTRTSEANGEFVWKRFSIPFDNEGPCTEPHYILFSLVTNELPGEGSTNDDIFVDDVLLIYNPTLQMGELESDHFVAGETITIPFTLSGTMSADNLNAAPNEVIAQLSDANGSFDNPIELGRVATDTTGSITATIPEGTEGERFNIRVVATNYPMVGGNIQEISIEDPYGMNENGVNCAIWPNPATSTLNITAESSILTVSIEDVSGRTVMKTHPENTELTIDLGGYQPGVYVVRMVTETTQMTRRFVKP